MPSGVVTSSGVVWPTVYPIVLYGAAAAPDPDFPPPRIDPFIQTVSPLIWPQLVPCQKCSKHVYAGTPCPFCYADAIAKAPSRADLEVVKAAIQASIKAMQDAHAQAVESMQAAHAKAIKALNDNLAVLEKAMEATK